MQALLDRMLVNLDVRLEAFALLEVRRGHRLKFDALEQVIVHYILSGSGWLETSASEPVSCSAGSVVILPAQFKQAFRVGDSVRHEVDAGESCSMVKDGLVRFGTFATGAADLRVLCGSVMATPARSFGLLETLRAPLVERFECNAVVKESFALLRNEVASPTFGTRAVAGSIMKLCLVLLIREHLAGLRAPSPLIVALGDSRLTSAINAVLEAPAAAHTVAGLAAVARMSRSAFAQAFTHTFDMSPMEFVAKTRLHHAAELLRSTDLPLKVISASIGFQSRSHFSRAFKAAFGHGPRSYRKAQHESTTSSPRSLYGTREKFALEEEPEGN